MPGGWVNEVTREFFVQYLDMVPFAKKLTSVAPPLAVWIAVLGSLDVADVQTVYKVKLWCTFYLYNLLPTLLGK